MDTERREIVIEERRSRGRSARVGGPHVVDRRARRDDPSPSPDETRLIDAVRAGDPDAFGVLYSRHVDAVSAVARRFGRNSHEADDVTSEVFCNALRAIRNGHGPSDDMLPYLLRSVRHTITKLRTRTDTAHATPVASEQIDRIDPSVLFPAPGPEAQAFRHVSERFQRTLWSVEVEGVPTAVLAADEDISAPAGASLAYRARCALRRAYVAASMDPPVSTACRPFRALVPSFLDGGLGHASSARLQAHTDECGECAEAVDGARSLHGTLGNSSWFSLLLANVRHLGLSGAQTVGAAVAAVPTAAGMAAVASTAVVSFAAAAVIHDDDRAPTATATADAIAAADRRGAGTEPDAATERRGVDGVDTDDDPKDVRADVTEPTARPRSTTPDATLRPATPSTSPTDGTDQPRSATGSDGREREAAVTTTTTNAIAIDVVTPTVAATPVVGDVPAVTSVHDPILPADDEADSVDAVTDAVTDVDGPMTGLLSGPTIDEAAIVATVVDDVVEPVVAPVVDEVIRPVAEPIVEPVVDDVVEPVVAPVVDEVVEPVVAPVVDEVIEPVVAPIVIEPVVVAPVVDAVVDAVPTDPPACGGGLLGRVCRGG